jgi:hypothetical protein
MSDALRVVVRVCEIRSDVWEPCPACGHTVAYGHDIGHALADRVNHLIDTHGWKLLHVGQETTGSREHGNAYDVTVAVVGEFPLSMGNDEFRDMLTRHFGAE